MSHHVLRKELANNSPEEEEEEEEKPQPRGKAKAGWLFRLVRGSSQISKCKVCPYAVWVANQVQDASTATRQRQRAEPSPKRLPDVTGLLAYLWSFMKSSSYKCSFLLGLLRQHCPMEQAFTQHSFSLRRKRKKNKKKNREQRPKPKLLVAQKKRSFAKGGCFPTD